MDTEKVKKSLGALLGRLSQTPLNFQTPLNGTQNVALLQIVSEESFPVFLSLKDMRTSSKNKPNSEKMDLDQLADKIITTFEEEQMKNSSLDEETNKSIQEAREQFSKIRKEVNRLLDEAEKKTLMQVAYRYTSAFVQDLAEGRLKTNFELFSSIEMLVRNYAAQNKEEFLKKTMEKVQRISLELPVVITECIAAMSVRTAKLGREMTRTSTEFMRNSQFGVDQEPKGAKKKPENESKVQADIFSREDLDKGSFKEFSSMREVEAQKEVEKKLDFKETEPKQNAPKVNIRENGGSGTKEDRIIERLLPSLQKMECMDEELVLEKLQGAISYLTFESSLVNKQEGLNFFKEKLRHVFLDAKFVLLFQGTTDGFDAEKFHEKCDGKGPTLTLVKTTTGKIFGGFANKPWQSEGNWQEDEHAFLFSWDYKEIYNQVRDKKKALRFDKLRGPGFGNGCDLILYDKCNENMSSYMSINHVYTSNGRSREAISGGEYFKVEDYEVFLVM